MVTSNTSPQAPLNKTQGNFMGGTAGGLRLIVLSARSQLTWNGCRFKFAAKRITRHLDMYEDISYGHYQENGPWQDKNLYWTGFIYFVGLYAFGVAWWQAALVATAAFTCWYLSYSRVALAGIGIAVFFAGLGTWIGLIPHWH